MGLRKGLLAFLALTVVVAPCLAKNNIGDVKRGVEAKGGKIIWGKTLDHAEYLVCAASIATGTLPAYLENLAIEVGRSLGEPVAKELLARAIKGEKVTIGGNTIQGGIVSYNHWKRMSWTYWTWVGGVFGHSKEMTGYTDTPLPNTHQVYVRIKS